MQNSEFLCGGERGLLLTMTLYLFVWMGKVKWPVHAYACFYEVTKKRGREGQQRSGPEGRRPCLASWEVKNGVPA